MDPFLQKETGKSTGATGMDGDGRERVRTRTGGRTKRGGAEATGWEGQSKGDKGRNGSGGGKRKMMRA